VLVVANVTGEAQTGLRLAGPVGALPAGRYEQPLDLLTAPGNARWESSRALGGPIRAAALTVGADGSFVDYAPLQAIGARTAYVFVLR
jgi:hypothetical protein